MFFSKALGLLAATLLAQSPLSAASPIVLLDERASAYENSVYFVNW
jgi:hypothetical protein